MFRVDICYDGYVWSEFKECEYLFEAVAILEYQHQRYNDHVRVWDTNKDEEVPAIQLAMIRVYQRGQRKRHVPPQSQINWKRYGF